MNVNTFEKEKDLSRFTRKILITGGAGFIGSHTVRHFIHHYPHYLIVNLDLLTYAGNLDNLKDILSAPNHVFIRGDVADLPTVESIFQTFQIDGVIHLAAESHVDRSIYQPLQFLRTNVQGTLVLLEVARTYWQDRQDVRFYQISTDEVYGSLGTEGIFTESSPYQPRSPYSASKASADHFVRAYYHTYGLPVLISNCTNNFGPYQFPEKLIPLAILHFAEEKTVPIYGTGENVRDWLWVEDHVRAMDLIFHQGKPGTTYLISAHNEWKNIDLVRRIGQIVDEYLHRPEGYYQQFIRFVKDRPGHDFRYALDSSRIEQELGWKPSISFEEALRRTVRWYLENRQWVERVRSGEYRRFLQMHYGELLDEK